MVLNDLDNHQNNHIDWEVEKMFSFFKKKKKPKCDKFLTPFNSAFELLMTLTKDDNGNQRDFDPIEMATSASSIIGAAYILKKALPLGRVSESQVGPYMDEIESLFEYVAGVSIRELERQTEMKIDPQSDKFLEIADVFYQAQHDKTARYMNAIATIMKKGEGSSIGLDLAYEVQKDIFGDKFSDIIFSTSLLQLVATNMR